MAELEDPIEIYGDSGLRMEALLHGDGKVTYNPEHGNEIEAMPEVNAVDEGYEYYLTIYEADPRGGECGLTVVISLQGDSFNDFKKIPDKLKKDDSASMKTVGYLSVNSKKPDRKTMSISYLNPDGVEFAFKHIFDDHKNNRVFEAHLKDDTVDVSFKITPDEMQEIVDGFEELH